MYINLEKSILYEVLFWKIKNNYIESNLDIWKHFKGTNKNEKMGPILKFVSISNISEKQK